MIQLVSLIYLALVCFLGVLALFVVFHLVRYSYNKSATFFMTTLFLTVFSVLLAVNIAIFFALPLTDLLDAL